MSRDDVERRLEDFVRDRFTVADSDDRFDRTVPLFQHGYVDSIGVVELLAFLEEEFDVHVPDDVLLDDSFETIEGIAATVVRLGDGAG